MIRIRDGFLLLLLGWMPQVEAASFTGVVFEKGVRFPISEASVVVLPSKIRTTTDPQGRFFLNIPDAAVSQSKVIIQKAGYEKYEGDLSSLDRIYLNRISGLEYETTIVSQERKDPSLRKLRAREAIQLPGSADDAIKAIQNLPGVNRTPGFSSQIVVQGSAPEETLYSIDSHEVPIIFHFGGLSSVLMPELLGDIDFYTAGYQVPFGRALGGIINANSVSEVPLTENSRVSKGMAYFDLFNVGGAYSTPVGEESHLAFGGRASYVGAILKKVAMKNDNLSLTVAPAFQDFATVYETPLSSNAKFKLMGIYSNDSAEFVLKEPISNDPALRGGFSNSTRFYRLIPQVEWTHSAFSKSRFSMGVGQDLIESLIGDLYFRLNSKAMTVRGENETQLSPTWSQSAGFDHRYTWSDVSFTLPQIFSSGGVLNPISTGENRNGDLKGVKSHKIGLYWNHRLKTDEASLWTFYPGIRMDYFAIVRDVQLSPRFSIRYQPLPDLAWTLATGRYAQPPAEQFVSREFGNPDIRSTKAYHLSLKAEKDMSEEWSKGSQFTSGLFAKWLRDLILPDTGTLYANRGSGRAFGWENSVNYRFYPYTFYGAYTLSRSTRSEPGKGEFLSRYDQTHYFTVIGSVELPSNWRVSTRFRYVTGALSTPVLSGVWDADNDVYIPIRGNSFSERLGDFSSLDLRIDKRWVYDRWVLSFYVDVLNVLNRSNAESVQYSYDYRSKVNVAGLPILPTLGLKGEF